LDLASGVRLGDRLVWQLPLAGDPGSCQHDGPSS